jgi:hypothetical protein
VGDADTHVHLVSLLSWPLRAFSWSPGRYCHAADCMA